MNNFEVVKNLKTFNWENSLKGMRNPLQSWKINDSEVSWNKEKGEIPDIGLNDLKLCKKLIKAGSSHRKFLRQIQISCDLTASLKMFDEFATYLFIVSNSTSQMHLLGSTHLTKDNFTSIDPRVLIVLNEKIEAYLKVVRKEGLGKAKRSDEWRDMIDNVPQSFIYTRTITLNYETFLTIYPNRANHKMWEWRVFCHKIKNDAPYMKDFLNEMGLN